jgi:hypothetical protein
VNSTGIVFFQPDVNMDLAIAQIRVSNWRAFPNRLLPEFPASDQRRAISAMQ